MNWIDTVLKVMWYIGTYITGYLFAKNKVAKDKAEDKVDMLERYRKIDNTGVTDEEVADSTKW